MAAVKSGVVAVTGAAGFLGGWAVKLLLDRGYRVRACVRNAGDEVRVGFLKALPGFASGRLSIHSAELEEEGAFDAPFEGADAVLHISHVSNYNDHDYVARVCANVIGSVNRSGSVKRVVVTSSIAAVISEMDMAELARRPVCDEDRYPDELNPKRTPERGQGYSMGKLIAERAFADAAAANGSWDAITVCPGDNVGPILSKHQKNMGPWQHLIEKMLLGECQQNGVYRPWMTVDVRDDALCHIGIMESDTVKNGERYLAWSTDARKVEDICADIARLLPELNHATPPVTDHFPDRIREREAEFRATWAQLQLKNDRIRAATGVSFRPLDVSIRDCVESLIAVAGVRPVTRA